MSTSPARTLTVLFLILTPIGWAVTAVMQAWAGITRRREEARLARIKTANLKAIQRHIDTPLYLENPDAFTHPSKEQP